MSPLDTVRSHIEQELQDKKINLTQFEKISGINRGVLSATLNSNPPRSISINQLDRMAAALDRPEGWLYEQHVYRNVLI
ncbi:helix-turn-helix transcriptional regulator [Paenibacillus sp. PK4536]|uniref:helix-turn-helix domain-containing protein n=1 Tax=Paenibacillus sp. PK4536 TaxID=3024576 RepID=UPI0023589E4F|nr:helix-turn-helix transcriptional regulator [Paenibacillus sp. PK4536]WIM39963.1 helix-turn-helix transcriptional regulator [Paenibacillus sp. PK4536]